MEPYRIVVKQSVSKEPAANLLWTGGWDSTFQLLQLLLVQRRQVTSFYLIDAERPSTGVELQTMKRIKERILKNYPHTRELLQPTRFFAAADVAPDVEITAAFQEARKVHPLKRSIISSFRLEKRRSTEPPKPPGLGAGRTSTSGVHSLQKVPFRMGTFPRKVLIFKGILYSFSDPEHRGERSGRTIKLNSVFGR